MCRNISIIHYVIYECVDTQKILWQILHILCQLTFYVWDQMNHLKIYYLKIQVLLHLQTFNLQNFRNMDKLTPTSSSVFYRFWPAPEPIWNSGNGQKISCLLPQIKPWFLNYPTCSLMTILYILPQFLHYCECISTMASTTDTHHSRYRAKTVNACCWPKWTIQALDHSPQGWSTLYVVQAILQILSACRQHEIQHIKWRMSTHSYKLHVSILPLYFPMYHVPPPKKKKQEKYISKHRLGQGWRTFLRVCTRIFY